MCSAVSGGGGEKPQGGDDAFTKSLDALRDLLIPGAKKQDENKMRRVQAILERERGKPLSLRPMARPKKKSNKKR